MSLRKPESVFAVIQDDCIIHSVVHVVVQTCHIQQGPYDKRLWRPPDEYAIGFIGG